MKLELTLAENNPLGASGEKITLELTPSDVHDPTELPTYLAGYRPFGMRADEASPPILVDKDQDKYRTFSEDDTFKRVRVRGAALGNVPEVDPKSDLASYKVVERFLGSFIPDQTEMNATNPGYRPRQAAARRCRRAIDLDREIAVFAEMLGLNATWDSSVRTAAANVWTDIVAGTPIADLQSAIQKSHQPVSVVWMNQKVAHTFLRHPEVRDHMRQFYGDATPADVGRQMSAAAETGMGADFAIPGLPPIKVVQSKYKDASNVLQYVMPDVVVLETMPPGVPTDGEEIATTYTWRRRGASGVGFEVREFRIENRGSLGGTMVVVTTADAETMTSDTAGGIITAVV